MEIFIPMTKEGIFLCSCVSNNEEIAWWRLANKHNTTSEKINAIKRRLKASGDYEMKKLNILSLVA